MISFDDLINNSGGDTTELKNSIISVQINTVLNRDSIYNNESSISSLSSNTALLYSSITNMTSSTQSINIDYYSPFSDLYNSGYNNVYNVSDAFNNTAISGNFIANSQLTAKPILNFSSDNITSLCLNAEGMNFNNNTLNSEYFGKPVILNYDSLDSNIFSKGNALIITGKSADSNSFEGFNMFVKDGLFEAKHNTYLSISSLKVVDKDSFNANVLDNIAYANVEATAQQANHYTSIRIGNFSAISNLQHSIISCDKLNINANDDILQTINNNGYINYNDYLFSSNSINSNTFIKVDGLTHLNNTFKSNTYILMSGDSYSKNNLQYNSIVDFIYNTMAKNTIKYDTMLKGCGVDLMSNTLDGYVADISARFWNKNEFSPDLGTIKAYSLNDSNNGSAYIDYMSYGGFLTLNVIIASETKFNTFNHLNGKFKNLLSCYFTKCNFCDFQGYLSYNTFTKATDYKYIGTIFCDNKLYDMINVKNTILSHKWNKYQNIMNLEIDDISTAGRNSYIDIDNLTHNYYSMNESFSQDMYENITRLFISDSILFNDSLSNTFNSVSSVYFKFNDCVYDSNHSFTFSHSNIDSNNIYVDNIPVSWINSWFNYSTQTGGGGGGDYLEAYSAHSNLSYMYNINDTLSSAVFNNNLYSAGPNFNWDNMTVSQGVYLNVEGYSLGSNSIYNNSSKMNLKYNYISSNTFISCSFIDLNFVNNNKNSFKANTLININGVNLVNNVFSLNGYLALNLAVNSINSYSYNNNIYCYGYSLSANVFNGNHVCNFNVGSLYDNGLYGNHNINMTCSNINYMNMNSFTNLNINCNTIANANFNTGNMFNITAESFNNIQLKSNTSGKINCDSIEYLYCTGDSDYGKLSIKAFYIGSMFVQSLNALTIDLTAVPMLNCNIRDVNKLHIVNPNQFYFTISDVPYASQNLSNNAYVYNCSIFEIEHISQALNAGTYSLTWIPSQSLYINGIPYSKCI